MTEVDLSEFMQANNRTRGGCVVGKIIAKIEAEDPERAAKLRTAMDTPEIQHSAIVRVLASWGHETTGGSIAYHRRSCACYKVHQ